MLQFHPRLPSNPHPIASIQGSTGALLSRSIPWTAWEIAASGPMELATSLSTGLVGDYKGCLEGSLDSSLNATNTVTFGTQFVADDEYIVIKVEVDASFTGYVSSMSVSWS